jgi:hypothetical protein
MKKHAIAFPWSIWTRNYTVGDTSNEAEHDGYGRNATVIRTVLVKFVAVCSFISAIFLEHST